MEDGPMYGRYTITHKDGKPINPNKRYFVLDLSDPDERELAGLRAYAKACAETGYERLAISIYAAIGDVSFVPSPGDDDQ